MIFNGYWVDIEHIFNGYPMDIGGKYQNQWILTGYSWLTYSGDTSYSTWNSQTNIVHCDVIFWVTQNHIHVRDIYICIYIYVCIYTYIILYYIILYYIKLDYIILYYIILHYIVLYCIIIYIYISIYVDTYMDVVFRWWYVRF